MQPIWIEITTQIVRGMLTSLGAYLIRKGWVESTAWLQFVDSAALGIATTILGVAWIAIAEIRKRKETLVAREMPASTLLSTIKAKARSAFAPSVKIVQSLLLPLLLCSALFSVGCASSNWRHVATVANDKAAIGLQALQTEVGRGHDRMCGAQKCISDTDYSRLQSKIGAAARIGDAFTTALDHADKQDAMGQAAAMLTFVQDVINNDVPRLPDDIKVIVSASLNSARIALAAFTPTAAPPPATPPLER